MGLGRVGVRRRRREAAQSPLTHLGQGSASAGGPPHARVAPLVHQPPPPVAVVLHGQLAQLQHVDAAAAWRRAGRGGVKVLELCQSAVQDYGRPVRRWVDQGRGPDVGSRAGRGAGAHAGQACAPGGQRRRRSWRCATGGGGQRGGGAWAGRGLAAAAHSPLTHLGQGAASAGGPPHVRAVPRVDQPPPWLAVVPHCWLAQVQNLDAAAPGPCGAHPARRPRQGARTVPAGKRGTTASHGGGCVRPGKALTWGCAGEGGALGIIQGRPARSAARAAAAAAARSQAPRRAARWVAEARGGCTGGAAPQPRLRLVAGWPKPGGAS